MNDIQIFIDEAGNYRNGRHLEQFHDTKDRLLCISIEAAESNELLLRLATVEKSKETAKIYG